jgi:hypothetical protein
MALVVSGVMAVLQALSSHFVVNTQSFEMLSDYEWTLTGDVVPTAKANMLAAAMADIILYGSQMLAQIMQVLVVPST